jgi:hypothetical protein
MEGRIPFTGLMDDVKIYNQQRNLTIYNLTLPTINCIIDVSKNAILPLWFISLSPLPPHHRGFFSPSILCGGFSYTNNSSSTDSKNSSCPDLQKLNISLTFGHRLKRLEK